MAGGIFDVERHVEPTSVDHEAAAFEHGDLVFVVEFGEGDEVVGETDEIATVEKEFFDFAGGLRRVGDSLVEFLQFRGGGEELLVRNIVLQFVDGDLFDDGAFLSGHVAFECRECAADLRPVLTRDGFDVAKDGFDDFFSDINPPVAIERVDLVRIKRQQIGGDRRGNGQAVEIGIDFVRIGGIEGVGLADGTESLRDETFVKREHGAEFEEVFDFCGVLRGESREGGRVRSERHDVGLGFAGGNVPLFFPCEIVVCGGEEVGDILVRSA